MHHPQSSFTKKRPPADAALKSLLLNEPRSAVSKLRGLAKNTASESERDQLLAFLAHLNELFSPPWGELSTGCWNSLLKAGLPQLVIEILCKELESHPPHLYTLSGISISQNGHGPKLSGVSVDIHRANPIVDAMWPYRQGSEADVIMWTPLGQLVSLLGRQVTVWFKHPSGFLALTLSISNYSGSPRIFNPERPISALVFNAWLFANADPTIEQSTSLVLHQASATDLARFIQKFVIDDGKIFALRLKLGGAFKTGVVNERLEWLLGIATKLAGNLSLRLEVVAERVDVRLVSACNRQLEYGHREFDGNVFYFAVRLIYDLLYGLDPERDPRMAAVIGNDVFRFLARASILSAKLTDEHHEFVGEYWIPKDMHKKILETHIRHGEGPAGVDKDSDLALGPYKDLRSRFSQYLAVVVRHLRASPTRTQASTSLLEAWLNIASALGVDEPTDDKGVDSSVCGWKECHDLDRPAGKMDQCSGCKQIKYCGSNCQRRDWFEGGHKGKCKGIEGGS